MSRMTARSIISVSYTHLERLALDLGILGQETTGAAGVSFAMRSIPALAEYCELIKKLAKPGVKMCIRDSC